MKNPLLCFLLLPLLGACKPAKEEFLRSMYDFELDSGKYYLVATESFIGQRTGGYTRGPNSSLRKASTFFPEGNRFLFDDPEVLKRFRQKNRDVSWQHWRQWLSISFTEKRPADIDVSGQVYARYDIGYDSQRHTPALDPDCGAQASYRGDRTLAGNGQI